MRKNKQRDLERDVEKFRVLYDLAIAMTADRTLNENLQLIVDKSRELLATDTSYIALRDDIRGDVYMHSLSGIRTEAFKKMRLPFGKGLGGLVAKTRKGYIVDDYFGEESIEHIVDETVVSEGVISGMAAPIQMGSQNLGVLYVFNRTKSAFSQSDLDTLFLIGNLAAVEIARKRSEEELQKRTAEVTEAYGRLERAFREIKTNQDNIIRLERHAIASKVTSTLAHETRNPISAIGGFARILKRKFAEDPDLSSHFDIILEEAKRLEHLIAGILKAGHEVSADFQKLHAHELADAAYEATREKAHLAKIKLIKEVEPILSQVIGDRECLIMALKELILNAIEASSKHGQVFLIVSQENQWVIFTVRDEGKGIEQERQNKIYDPLFSTKKLSSGLGLSFAKEIIEAHNGYIKFESKLGAGTTFQLYLPASGPPSHN